jgi:hypothetical protein
MDHLVCGIIVGTEDAPIDKLAFTDRVCSLGRVDGQNISHMSIRKSTRVLQAGRLKHETKEVDGLIDGTQRP